MSKVSLTSLSSLQNETSAITTINNNFNIIENGFENTLSRDGTQPNPMVANLDMNSNRIFNLVEPNSATEPLRLQDLSNFIGGGTISTIPAGGSTGQVLGKLSGADFDDGWITPKNPIDVRNFGVVGNGVADDTTAMQAAINSLGVTLGGSLYIPAGLTVKCLGTLSINTISDVTIYGDTNFGHVVNYPSVLRYTGTGSIFIDARNTVGFNLRNLSIDYTSSSFAGNLVDVSSNNPGVTVSSGATISNCHLGPNVSRTGTATLLNLNCHVSPYVSSNFFWRGLPSIVGGATSGQSIRATLVNNWFSDSDSCPIVEGGDGWVVQGNSFEPRHSGIGQAFVNTNPCKGMIWSGNWFGDVTVGTGTVWIDAHSVEGFTFTGNQIAGLGTIGGVGIKLTSCNGVQVDGNYFQLLDVGINVSTGSTGIKLGSNSFVNVTAPVQNPSNAVVDDFTLNTNGSTSISPSAVTLAKIQNIGSAKILGNNTGSPAAPVELGLGGGMVIAGSNLTTAAMTGDITTPSGSFVTTLATVNSNVGTFGSATQAPVVTVNGKGLTTAASNVTVTPAVGSITGLATGVGTFLATPTSANLAAAVTNETGTGNLVFSTSPALTTPTGIVKGDVGLGNVDNTSDTTKWAATKTLTNTTYDTAGTGNSFSINGVAVTANTGTGSVVRATSPTLVTPALGAATATTINGASIDNLAWSTYTSTFGATSGTATVVAKQKTLGKMVFVNIDVTFTSVVVGTFTVTLPTNSVNSGFLPGAVLSAGFQAFGAVNASSNSLNVFKYDGTQILANGSHIVLTGVYEAP